MNKLDRQILWQMFRPYLSLSLSFFGSGIGVLVFRHYWPKYFNMFAALFQFVFPILFILTISSGRKEK